MSDRDVRKLAKIVADHSRQIKGLSGGPQAAYSSIEGGSMDSYDSDGKLRLRIGAQDDGTHSIKYVQGPPPPRPTAPIVSVDGPVVRVRWDGQLMGGHIPEDFARIDVHFALASEDLEDGAAVRGNLATSAGNETVLAATQTGTYRVGLVAMSQSRARSEMSDTVEVEVTLVDLEGALDAVVENARGGSNYYTPTPPPGTGHTEDDLWFDTSEDEDGLTRYTPHRWDGQEWVSLGDERVQAIKDAIADFESDLNTVRDTADGKNRTFYQSTMPATPPARAGDLWFNTANGFRLHRHNGATFIEVADGRIAEVEDAVENIDISGPLSEARTEWLADAAADAQTKAQNAANAAEAAAKLYADQIAAGVEDVDLEGFKDYADNAAEQARQAAITAAIAEARVVANEARDEALAAALDADAVISQTVAQFESDLNLVRESADGKSKITWSPNTPSGEGKAGDTWFRMSGNNIIGHWRHSGGAWVSMSLSATVIPNLDAGKINSGTIDAARLAAGSITADKLLIGGAGNLLPGADDFATSRAGWSAFGHNANHPSVWLKGTQEVRTDAPFALRTGVTYKASVDVQASVPGTTFYWQVFNVDNAGINQYVFVQEAPGTSWTSHVAEFTVPATGNYRLRVFSNHSTGAPNPDGWQWFRAPRIVSMTGATLIEDGAITTDKIQAGAVGATAIAAESIDASKIVAGGIQADSLIVPGTVGSTLIRDGAITTSKIEAGAITAQSGIIGSLDAGVISSGTIDTARLAAGSITADLIAVGLAGNMVYDPLFNNPELSSARTGTSRWERVVNNGVAEIRATMPNPRSNADLLLNGLDGYASPYPASTGIKYVLEVDVEGPLSMFLRVRYATGGGGTPGTSIQQDLATGRRRARFEFDPQAYASAGTTVDAFGVTLRQPSSASVAVGQVTRVFSVRIATMSGATVIESGAITTEKIATGAITAESGIIGSLDAGVITVGEMNGARIEAGSIESEQLAFGAATGDVLSADALNFKTAVGLDIRGSSFRAGDAVEITEDFGIRQFGPDGALNVSLPSDGSPAEFRGDLSARTLTATGRMSVQGPGAIASGGVLELESGVVPPVAGPQITNTWDRVVFPPLLATERAVGIAWADGHWWRAVVVPTRIVEGQSRNCRVEKIHPDTPGTVVSQFWSRNDGRFGMTAIGSELFIFGGPVGASYGVAPTVQVYGADGQWKRSWTDEAYQNNGFDPGIGTDGASIIRAQCGATGILYLNYYNRTTGAYISTTNTGDLFNASVGGVYVGAADFGATQIVVAKKVARGATGLRQMVVFNATDPYAHRGDLSWYAAGFDAPVGMVWDGTNFLTLHQDGSLHSYLPLSADQFVGDDEDDWWGAVAWSSADNAQVTPVGPATQFRYLKRSLIRRQNGDVPDGVERARLYLAKKSTLPTRTDLRFVSVSSSPRSATTVWGIPSNWESQSRPPLTNSYVTDAPGEIRSTLGTFRVDGTGAGEWGPLTFHDDGTMTGVPRTAAGVAVLSANATANGGKSSVVVTFPPGRFDTPPAVTAIVENGRLVPSVEAGTLTKTSVQLNVFNWTTVASGSGVRMHWTAVEVSS